MKTKGTIEVVFIQSTNKDDIGSIKSVKRGYFRYLSTRGVVEICNEKNKAAALEIQKERADKIKSKLEQAQLLKEKIESDIIDFIVEKSNSSDVLYDSIGIKELRNKLIEKGYDHLVDVSVNKIKKCGIYEAKVHIYANISAKFLVNVAENTEALNLQLNTYKNEGKK